MKDLSKQPIYNTPFSLAYWKDAAAQLKDVRILCIAAILIAMRVALKIPQIPVGPNLNIQIAFFINALGACIFGPVVAVVAAAVSDVLGVMVTTGLATYYPPFILVEIAGSLLFALWLWRAKLSAARVILSRFSVVAVCNFLLNPIIMVWYYEWLNNGKTYAFITVPRVMKNLALFPAEALLLVIFMGAVIPLIAKMKIIPKAQTKPVLTRQHMVLIGVLAVISVGIVLSYYYIYLPNK